MTAVLIAFLLLSGGGIKPAWRHLMNPKVQVELHLTATQSASLQKIWHDATSELERRQQNTVVAAANTKENLIFAVAEPSVEKFGLGLSKVQIKRLTEISVQEWGPGCWNYAGVGSVLKLSQAQQIQIADRQLLVTEDYRGRISKYAKEHHVRMEPTKGGGEIPELTPEIKQLYDKRSEALWHALYLVLNADQKVKLRKLLGDPFKF
jgi:hypothetical protein